MEDELFIADNEKQILNNLLNENTPESIAELNSFLKKHYPKFDETKLKESLIGYISSRELEKIPLLQKYGKALDFQKDVISQKKLNNEFVNFTLYKNAFDLRANLVMQLERSITSRLELENVLRKTTDLEIKNKCESRISSYKAIELGLSKEIKKTSVIFYEFKDKLHPSIYAKKVSELATQLGTGSFVEMCLYYDYLGSVHSFINYMHKENLLVQKEFRILQNEIEKNNLNIDLNNLNCSMKLYDQKCIRLISDKYSVDKCPNWNKSIVLEDKKNFSNETKFLKRKFSNYKRCIDLIVEARSGSGTGLAEHNRSIKSILGNNPEANSFRKVEL